jgi:hypothetical protein
MRIFWAWQSDTDQAVCRFLVKKALDVAIQDLAGELDERPELDHDTKDLPGMPDIVASIFAKIDAATAFVADVTTVAKTDKNKAVANPNVLMELGYAKKAISPDNIICVANTHWFDIADLPFDLRNRRGPILYSLPPDSDANARNAARNQLAKDLKNALLSILKNTPTQPSSSMLRSSRDRDPSIWLPKGSKLVHQGFHGSGQQEVTVYEGPRAYIRAAPERWKTTPTRAQLRELPEFWAPPVARDGDGGLNADGRIVYWFSEHSQLGRVAVSALQVFLEPAEAWCYFGKVYSDVNGADFLATTFVREQWRDALDNVFRFFRELQAIGPFRVEAGIVGISKLHWPNEFQRILPVVDAVRHEKSIVGWEDARSAFLAELDALLVDAYGLSIGSLKRLD